MKKHSVFLAGKGCVFAFILLIFPAADVLVFVFEFVPDGEEYADDER
jgi:hypothetical protein